eukprot:s1141_g4.t1
MAPQKAQLWRRHSKIGIRIRSTRQHRQAKSQNIGDLPSPGLLSSGDLTILYQQWNACPQLLNNAGVLPHDLLHQKKVGLPISAEAVWRQYRDKFWRLQDGNGLEGGNCGNPSSGV